MKSLVKIGFDKKSASPKPIAMILSCLVGGHATAALLSSTTPLITARGSQTATLLSDGRLLVAGGQTNGGFTSSSTELYDPAAGIWTATSPMNADHAHHTTTMLPNGEILVAGGFSSANGPLSSAELFNPVTGT